MRLRPRASLFVRVTASLAAVLAVSFAIAALLCISAGRGALEKRVREDLQAVAQMARVETERQETQRHLGGVAPDGLAVMGRGERVVVHDAVDGVVALLHRDVVAERAQVVAHMRQPRGLDAAEDPLARGGVTTQGRLDGISEDAGHGGRVYRSRMIPG